MAEEELPHKLVLDGRKKLNVTGVTEVIRFEDTCAVLKTVRGILVVQGETLKLRTLSLEGGEMAVEGLISALFYEEPAGRRGRLGRGGR